MVGQLSKNTQIFARFFADVGAQLNALLDSPDPLHTASDRLQHALLATLGAYVLHDHARLARGTLFTKTVLAALASSIDGRSTQADLLANVKKLLPAEEVTAQQVEATIEHLIRAGECSVKDPYIVCSDSVKLSCVAAAKKADEGYSKLHEHLFAACAKNGRLSDAQIGYLERNLRRSIVHLLRGSGPLTTNDENGLHFDSAVVEEVSAVLGKDLPPEMAQTAIIALSSFVTNPELGPSLAPLVKSYAALAIRNLDPVGRRWQQTVLNRSLIAIDTDVLLSVIIEELPEHNALISALRSLNSEGVEIVIPQHVFIEAQDHLERAPLTYRRFADRLLRFPAALVDGRVWHAVVRGFYYAKKAGYRNDFDSFYAKYHSSQNSKSFTEHLIARRLPFAHIKELDEVAEKNTDTLYALEEMILSFREKNRKKATFRDPAAMAQRVREDVSMALFLAEKSNTSVGSPAKGYVASADRAFHMIETNDEWPPRKSVHIWTRALPQLAFFACGATLEPNEAVDFVFSPVTVAAADLMSADINLLASIGVDLKEASLDRLDWDLRQGMSEHLETLHSTVIAAATDTDLPSAVATLRVAQAAVQAGYRIAIPQVEVLINEFDSTKEELAHEKLRRRQTEDQFRHLIQSMRDQLTNKTRTKMNKLFREAGLSLANENPDE